MRKVAGIVLVLACLSAGIASFAQELTVVTEEWAPYNFTENGVLKGVSTDIVRKVLDKTGLKYAIHVFPWSRAYYMAQAEPNVLIYTIIRIPARESMFKWVSPLGKGGTTSLYRLKTKVGVNPANIEEAKGFSVVANDNSMDELWLTMNNFRKLETPVTVESAIKLFMYGRVDMIAFDDSVMKAEFSKFGFDTADTVKLLGLFGTPPFMAVSLRTDDAIVRKIQKAYDELLKSGEIRMVN